MLIMNKVKRKGWFRLINTDVLADMIVTVIWCVILFWVIVVAVSGIWISLSVIEEVLTK